MSDFGVVQDLVNRFTDAVNRQDKGLFESLWAPEATWRIDPPTDFTVAGTPAEIAGAFAVGMEANWEWFVQLPHALVLTGEDAGSIRARSYLVEKATAKTGDSYSNIGFYDDQIVEADGRWVFRERHYGYIYIDAVPLTGQGFKIT